MKKPRTKPRPPDISPLPADACASCGTRMPERKAKLSFPVNGEKGVVPQALHLRCSKSGESVLRLGDTRHPRGGALAIYRKKYGLPSSDEIRSIRERLDLTQAALSKL